MYYYAIVDATRIEDMPAQLFELEEDPQYYSLFFDTPQAELTEAAPYLVQLESNSPFVEWLLDECWGQSWGIFLNSEADLDEVLEHLQSLLKVQDPEGKELFFRFYDPRVLRVYLPTCNNQELYQFFGPIVSYVAEDEKAEKFLQFIKGKQGIEIENISVFF
jgi:hypothetical protein